MKIIDQSETEYFVPVVIGYKTIQLVNVKELLPL